LAFRSRSNNDESANGFSLIEMLVVLTIVGLLVSLVGPKVLSYVSSSRTKTAQLQIQNFRSALDLFYLDVGRYPTTSESLTALVQKPSAVNGWNGPYLKTETVPRDPWGASYVYRSPGEHQIYDIASYGADGREGGTKEDADIVSW
jgi:general secretion pathway protein G